MKFASRILAEEEMSLLPSAAAGYLASRFAVKEAAAKALGTGFAQGITMKQIAVRSAAGGAPQLVLHGKALERSNGLGASRAHLSLSHERSAAVAVVILEGETGER
jgi:holo-[acyl-carrier protein] synthase